MYVGTRGWVEGEEAPELGQNGRRVGAISVMAPRSSAQDGALEAGATFLQRHWWLWPTIVIVCGAIAGAFGLAQATCLDGR